jgi:glycosyltransferase 2 family protein
MERAFSRKKLAAVLLLTIFFLVLVLWELELSRALTALKEAELLLFVPMAICYLLGHTLRSCRLWILLEKQRPFWRIFSINSIGFLAINVMPLRMGELVRPYLLLEKENIPVAKSLAAVLLERLLDVSMLLLLLLGVTWVVELPPQGVELAGVDLLSVGQRGSGMLLVVGILGGSLLVWRGPWISKLLERMPMGEKVAGFVELFREGLATLFAHPARALLLLSISVAIWGLTLIGVQLVLLAFSGLPSSFAVSWVVWTVVLTAMTAVPTPGFFGIYELACVAALQLWLVEATLARTFAIVLHLGQFFFILLLGGGFVIKEGLTLQDLAKRPDVE